MPYGNLRELPQGIRNVLPKAAQDIWRRSYNKGRAAGWKDGKRGEELKTQARQWAWQAVKAAGYVKDEKTGKWKLSKTAKKGVQAAAERAYPAPHCGLPGEKGGSAPRDACVTDGADGPKQNRKNVVTPVQRKEVLRHLKARAGWLRGKIVIQWVEPVLEPKETQKIHVLATVETTGGTVRKWGVDDIPELVRHPYSIGNLSMRISRLTRRRREPPSVVKFDW